MPDSAPVTAGGSIDDGRLESWKEIAAYLRRDVTTVQRWEKKESLPVHRHLHDKQGSVHAYKAELDSWRQARLVIVENDTTSPSASAPVWWHRGRPVLAVAAAATLLVVMAAMVLRVRDVAVSKPTYLALVIPAPWQYQPDASGSLAISPDGRRVVYAAADGKRRSLFVRSLDEPSAIALEGTAEAVGPFFSPDGRWIGFSTNTELRKIPVEGGVATTICSIAATARGAQWSSNGSIYFSLRIPGGVLRVDANGGTATPVTITSGTEMFHRAPWMTDAGQLLYTVRPPADNGVVYRSEADGTDRSVLLGNATAPRITPSGMLSFVRDGNLFVVQLDKAQRNAVSEPQEIATNLTRNVNGADYAFSNTNTLVYAAAPIDADQMQIEWVARDGSTQPVGEPGRYVSVRLSPNGQYAAIQVAVGTESHLLIHDFTTRQSRPLTLSGTSRWPVWLPDSQSVAFLSIGLPSAAGQILTQKILGGSAATPLVESRAGEFHVPVSWTRDGMQLFARDVNGELFVVPAGQPPQKFTVQGIGVEDPQISPDGKWLAFVAIDGGLPRVYVQRFPELKERWLVSPDGGLSPRWSRQGDRLYFTSDGSMFQVNVTHETTFIANAPERIFTSTHGPGFDVAADNDRFLMMRRLREEPIRHINVVLNWLR